MDASNLVSALLLLFVVFAILVAIFLICREIVCWYWKINAQVALLTEIRDLLRQRAIPPASGTPPVMPE